MVEWTDFDLVLFLEFLLDCWCQLTSQTPGPRGSPDSASSGPLHLPFRDASTPYSSSLSSTTSFLQRESLLPDSAGSTGVDAANELQISALTRNCLLSHTFPLLRCLQGQRLGPHVPPPFCFGFVAYRIYFCAGSLFNQGCGDNGSIPPWRRWDQGEGGCEGKENQQ